MDMWDPVKKTAQLGAVALAFAIFVWQLYRWSFTSDSFGRALVFHLVVGWLASGALATYWDRAWHAGIGNRIVGARVALVPALASFFGVIQAWIGSTTNSFLSVLGTTAEAYKWSMTIVCGALLAAMLAELSMLILIITSVLSMLEEGELLTVMTAWAESNIPNEKCAVVINQDNTEGNNITHKI